MSGEVSKNLIRALPEVVAREYPELGLTEGRWRYLLRERKTNGLSSAIISLGGPRRLFLDTAKFEEWLEQQREAAV